MEWLTQIDTQLFYFFNVTLQNVFFDWLMPIITEKRNWFPVWGVAIVLLLWKGGKRGLIVVLLLIPVVALSDQISSHILKPYFGRLRPCVALPDIHLLLNKKTSWSMPSGHATNFFAVATVFSYFFRKYKWWYFGAAAAVGYSRIAVGVHYPFDVLAGAALGMTIAAAVIAVWYALQKRVPQLRIGK